MFNSTNSRRLNYYLKDMGGLGRAVRGVEVVTPANHPISSVKAMRGAFYAAEQQLLVPYSRAVFETYWGGTAPDICRRRGAGRDLRGGVGLDADSFFRAINQPALQGSAAGQHHRRADRARRLRLPDMFIDGDDMYFGNDRLRWWSSGYDSCSLSTTPLE